MMKFSNGKAFSLRRKNKGFNLIELGIVMVVIAVAVAAVGLGARALMRSTKVNGETDRISFMASKYRGYLSTSVDTSGVSNTQAVTIHAVRDDAVSGASTILSRFGGQVTVAPATLMTANDAVSFQYAGVGQDECIAFVKQAAGQFNQISVNGTVVKSTTASVVTDATLEGASTNTAAGNTIVFTLSKN